MLVDSLALHVDSGAPEKFDKTRFADPANPQSNADKSLAGCDPGFTVGQYMQYEVSGRSISVTDPAGAVTSGCGIGAAGRFECVSNPHRSTADPTMGWTRVAVWRRSTVRGWRRVRRRGGGGLSQTIPAEKWFPCPAMAFCDSSNLGRYRMKL